MCVLSLPWLGSRYWQVWASKLPDGASAAEQPGQSCCVKDTQVWRDPKSVLEILFPALLFSCCMYIIWFMPLPFPPLSCWTLCPILRNYYVLYGKLEAFMHESLEIMAVMGSVTQKHTRDGFWNGGLHLSCTIYPAGGRPGHMCLGCYFKSMLDLFDDVLQSSLFVQMQCFITESGVLLLNWGFSIQNALHFSLLCLFIVKSIYFPCYCL